MGQFASAIENYDNALALDRRFTAGYLYRGFAYAESGQPDRAAGEYKSAAANPPLCAAIAEGRGFGGDFYSVRPRPPAEEGTLMLPVEGESPNMIITPDSVANRPCVRPQLVTAGMLQAFPAGSTGEADFYQRRCAARAMDNVDLPLALADCNKAIALNSSFARAHDARGLVRFRQNAYADCIADLTAALAINPRLASSLYIRGLARIRSGDVDGARADLLAARSISPEIAADLAVYGVAP
jgi:tetratricopeptide (TPR) repeat protein